MARIMLAWELGAGMGHLSNILPIGSALLERGHAVVAVIKQQARPFSFPEAQRIPILFGPPDQSPCGRFYKITNTYTQLLHNVGFGDFEYLSAKVRAWQKLIRDWQPDLIVGEHSPTVILAARTLNCPIVYLGTGFTCPTTSPTLPIMDERHCPSPERQVAEEQFLVNHVNAILHDTPGAKIDRLGELYAGIQSQFLLTFEELDHFGPRPGTRYWGSWNFIAGESVDFPVGRGPKIFAYLKPSKGIVPLLEELKQQAWPALIVNTSFTPEFIQQHATATLHLRNTIVNIEQAAEWCDFAILNATQATVSAVLRAGKPILNIPLNQEQILMSKKIVQLKTGGAVDPEDPQALLDSLRVLAQHHQELAGNAEVFAAKYRGYSLERSIMTVADQIGAIA